MTELQDVAAIVTAIVAIYAAGLSTYNFLVKRRENQPQLHLGYRPGFIEFGARQLSEAVIYLEASNVGSKPVRIASHSNLQILLPDGRYHVPREDWQSNVSFPYELSPGRSFSIWRDMRAFARSLKEHGFSGKVKLRVICTDEAGRIYKGKRLPFDIESWAKPRQPVNP